MKNIKRITSLIVALSMALAIVSVSAATVTDLNWYTGKDSETGLRHITLLANIAGDDVTAYGVELNGVKYPAKTELSKNGGFGMQFFNVAKGVNYTAKTYAETANGTVYGEEQTVSYKGPGYASDDFSGAVITPATVTNAEWFDGYGWIDENEESVRYENMDWTKGTFSSSSAAGLTYSLSDSTYLGLSVENGGLLLDPGKGGVYAPTMDFDVNFEAVSSGIAEISFKYDVKRWIGVNTANLGMIHSGTSVVGGLVLAQGNRLSYKTGTAQAARTDVDQKFVNLNKVHDVKYIVDMTNSNIDIYIDGEMVVENQPFINAATAIDRLSFQTPGGGNPNANSPKYWIDDITVVSD